MLSHAPEAILLVGLAQRPQIAEDHILDQILVADQDLEEEAAGRHYLIESVTLATGKLLLQGNV